MSKAEVLGFEKLRISEFECLRSQYKVLVQKYQESDCVMKQVYDILSDIVSVGKSADLAIIVNNAVEDRNNLCEILKGKKLFSALYGIHTGR
jgi:hypothetical protein